MRASLPPGCLLAGPPSSPPCVLSIACRCARGCCQTAAPCRCRRLAGVAVRAAPGAKLCRRCVMMAPQAVHDDYGRWGSRFSRGRLGWECLGSGRGGGEVGAGRHTSGMPSRRRAAAAGRAAGQVRNLRGNRWAVRATVKRCRFSPHSSVPPY